MTIPKVSQEADDAAAELWLEVAHASPEIYGDADAWHALYAKSFAQFEQLIRSKVIDEAAGDAMAYAEAAGRARCAKPGDEQAEWYWAGKASAAREIASSIRQLGESGRP
jgi:hypothetical protein